MMAAEFDIRIDDTAVRGWVDGILSRLRNTQPAMDAIEKYMLGSVRTNFLGEHAPDGKPWAPLSPVTLARRRRRGNFATTILTDTRKLRLSVTATTRNNQVTIGSNLPYAAMMQYGGTKARFPHLWGDIPARAYLGFAPDDRDNIAQIMREHLRGNPFRRR